MIPTITFLSWPYLIGILSAAIPLVIHLSRSRRTKKMPFSTTRFFTDQFLRSYRMSRLKELLLLACRMVLFGLLATALARPLLLPKAQGAVLPGSRSVVLVLDNSASMGYLEAGVPVFERAKQAARDVIRGLADGDTATVVLAGRRASGPEVLVPEPTADREEVLARVDALEPTALGTDLTGALTAAEKIALSRRESSREVYVLSDFQDSGWELGDDRPTPAGAAELVYFLVGVRPQAASNLAVTALQYGAARPLAGVPFLIRPHIASQGDRDRAGVVRLIVDGEQVAERKLERLRNGQWAVPRFYHTFTKGGWHQGHVEVEDDNLPLDNKRYFALEVLDWVRILAVNGAPSEVPRLDELFFLKTALTAAADGKSPVQVDVREPDGLAADVRKYPLVILANVARLTDDTLERLEDFVDQGGSLLVFLGDRVQPAFYNDKLTAPERLHGGLLPARLVGLEGNPTRDDAFAAVSGVDYEHPALAAFQDAPAGLTAVTLRALWNVDPGRSSVLMQAAASGKPALPLLLEKPFGKGRVMLFTSTCDRDWTNFPVRPAYLPFLHRLVAYLAQQPAAARPFYATGDGIPLPVSPEEQGSEVAVKRPDGRVAFPDRTDEPEPRLVFTDTALPGVYSFWRPAAKENSWLAAVNVEGYESDLTYLDDVLAEGQDGSGRREKVEAGFKKLLGEGRPLVHYVDDPARLNEAALASRRPTHLWDAVLWIVLAIALFEPWLANRISLRHYLRPRAVPEPVAAAAGMARLGRPHRERVNA